MSTLMRRVHHVSLVAPYELCRVGDHGDTPVNPIDLMDSLARIEAGCTRPGRRRFRPAATIW
jgi:guanidinopropionase